MKIIRLVLATIFYLYCLSAVLLADNRYPIILVHGFMGWGRDEMGTYRYWGGKYDIEQYLVDQGYTVYTASVGPVSSNWDRAVELFYQIKGGQVDYGAAHSREFGLIQKPEGKYFPGVYPEWDQDHPVHLVGHSMGGQTIRMLQYLLANVIIDSLGRPEASDLLGKAHTGWVKSITSISTPHNGTTLSDIVVNTVPFLQDFIAVAAVIGNGFYDFDLEQWGFRRQPGELWMDYFRRVRNHPAWKTKNISAWDLSLEGAKQLNTLLTADPTVYYFSFSTSSTVLDSSTGRQVPSKDMSFILRANARIMGMKKAYWEDGTPTDSSWFENDGIVNTVSMAGPTTGENGPDPITVYREGELLMPGQWYYMGKFTADHKQFIGHGLKADEAMIMLERYKNHVARLWSLPE